MKTFLLPTLLLMLLFDMQAQALQNRDQQQDVIEKLGDRYLPQAWSYYYWGYQLHDRGKFDEAIENYRKAVEIDPTFERAYFHWGEALEEQGKLNEAIEKYREAVKVSPKYANAYTQWGNVLASQGKLDEAIERYREAVKVDAKSSYAYFNWGRVLDERGHLDEAIEKYRKAVEVDPVGPNSGFAKRNLGKALRKKNEQSVR